MVESPITLLSIAGFDPSGGAGLQADLVTGTALGAHVVTVMSAWTVQDSLGVQASHALDARQVLAQLEPLLADFRIAAIKIGMLGSAATAEMLADVLAPYAHLPIVIDPIWRSGGGQTLSDPRLLQVLRQRLVPMATVLTPNGPEALRLAESHDVDAAALALARAGSDWQLVSGGHGEGEQIDNRLYRGGVLYARHEQARRPGTYHGTGCTLSTALAVYLAQGQAVPDAVSMALQYTHAAVRAAYRPGRGQSYLDRCAPLAPGAAPSP